MCVACQSGGGSIANAPTGILLESVRKQEKNTKRHKDSNLSLGLIWGCWSCEAATLPQSPSQKSFNCHPNHKLMQYTGATHNRQTTDKHRPTKSADNNM